MSINQSHAAYGKGVVIFNGERILIFYDGVQLSLTPETGNEFMHGSHGGRIYLTTHRVIFVTNNQKDRLLSFSMPFTNMREVDIKQPIFGANRIEGAVTAEQSGGWQGKAKFSLTFNHGGAIEFGQALLEAGKRASQNRRGWVPPPFVMAPCAQYYDAPPPAYCSVYGDPYYGFVPQHSAFAPPPPGGVYVNMAPPPYPGVNSNVPPPYYMAPPPNVQPYHDQPPAYSSGQPPYPPNAQPPYPPSAQPPYPPQSMQYQQTPYNNGTNSNVYLSEAEQRKAHEAAGAQPTGGFYPANDPHMAYSVAPPPYNPSYKEGDKKAN